jgi:glutamate-1-semialdehyde aminotransferase
MKQKSIPITNSTGAKLWTRAKKIIPGGGQLLSKRSERFLPEYWPAYYKKAKGCEVWDLDGRHYFDFAQMGVGSCILGYADSEVDSQVIKAIQKGSMCTLNCSEEVRLAELLVELHPWAEMARFARTGGEACSIAVRIARAFSGRDKVAFCGYHGWHDWYLSANIANLKNLDGQLLPGLAPAGVPRSLREASFPFVYNEVESLKQIVRLHGSNLAAIIMEPVRGASPSPGFLEAVREIADKTNAVLIFDEVTSGFRMCLGGYHLITNVKPDLAVFAKGMSNGYPAAAVIGKKKIMNAAQESFISSTSWTERIGSVAAIATISGKSPIDFGSTDWFAVANSLWVATLPVLFRYFNKQDPVFGKVAEALAGEVTKTLKSKSTKK